tara:strand:+ start:2248 stop:2532 length:285 start_codon:yes stop_codon:yes gene_type:complete
MTVEAKKIKKTLSGEVVGNKMDKTIVVSVQRRFSHPVFKKIVSRNKKYKAHDEKNECSVGDVVEIRECRPLSREKRWRLVGVVERVKVAEAVQK